VGWDHVRRLSVTNDGSAVHAADRAHLGELWSTVLPNKRWKHSDDYLFLFARIVVFVEGVHDAVVHAEWFTAWAQNQKLTEGDDYSAELQIHWQPAGGKNAEASRACLAEQLGIPWFALYDADVLQQLSENQAIVEDWHQSGFVSHDAAIQLGTTGWLSKIPECSSRRIFFCGNDMGVALLKGTITKRVASL